MTKQQLLRAYDHYCNSTWHSVTEAYVKPSCYKVQAEKRILEEMNKNDGYDYRIVYNGCQDFSCAYCTKTEWIYHTHGGIHRIPLNKLVTK